MEKFQAFVPASRVVLVDSSVWIDLPRGRDTLPTRALRNLVATDDAAIAPVTYQEILQGAASKTRFEKLRASFGTLPILLPRHDVTAFAPVQSLSGSIPRRLRRKLLG